MRMHSILWIDRKSTRLNSSHIPISYAVFCLKKKMTKFRARTATFGLLKSNFTKAQPYFNHAPLHKYPYVVNNYLNVVDYVFFFKIRGAPRVRPFSPTPAPPV